MARHSEEWAAGLIKGFRFPARFQVERVIGRGGSGAVLAALDRRMGRRVAIKALDATSEMGQLDDVVGEAEVLAALTHPNLVTVHDVFTGRSAGGQDVTFLVMEHVDGPDLAQFLRTGRLTATQILQTAQQLISALQYVHDRGYLHRDIKPSNVLLQFYGPDVHARLSDFGTAILAAGPVEQGEFTVGTAAYLSPEQAEGSALTPASDVYSLGLVLLEAATGQVAFPGSILESAMARLDTDPVVPTDVAEPLRQVLLGMTSRDPARRYTLARCRQLLDQGAVAAPAAESSSDGGAVLAAGAASAQEPRSQTSTTSFFRPQEEELQRLLQLVTQVLAADGAALLQVQDGQLRHRAEYRLPELGTVRLRQELRSSSPLEQDGAVHVLDDTRFLIHSCGAEDGEARYLAVALGEQRLRADALSMVRGFAEVITAALTLRSSLRRALFAR